MNARSPLRKSRIFNMILLVLTTSVVGCGAEPVDVSFDVVYGHKHGLALSMDVFTPQENANGAGVLFLVSGGWWSAWHPPEEAIAWFKLLLDKGYTVFAVRHGSSPKFVIPEIVADVRRSARFVRANAKRFGVDPQRLGVSGESAGGHLSLVLGTTGDDGDPDAKDEIDRVSSRVAAVVAYYPPTDLRQWMNPESPYYVTFPALQFSSEQADEVSPALHASRDDAPTLLIHGDKDEIVPIKHSEQMFAAFKEKSVECELVVIEGASHEFVGSDANRAAAARLAWFDKHLRSQ